MKRIGINSGRTDGDTIIRLLLLDSILVEFYTRFTSKWDYQWEHLEWKKKKKKETHRSQFGSSHCRWKSISIGGSLARKKEERREERARRGSLFRVEFESNGRLYRFHANLFLCPSLSMSYHFFAPSFISSSTFEDVTERNFRRWFLQSFTKFKLLLEI